jgi:hypothetical protein
MPTYPTVTNQCDQDLSDLPIFQTRMGPYGGICWEKNMRKRTGISQIHCLFLKEPFSKSPNLTGFNLKKISLAPPEPISTVPAVSGFISKNNFSISSFTDFISKNIFLIATVLDFDPDITGFIPAVFDLIPVMADFIATVSTIDRVIPDFVPAISDFIPVMADCA